MNPFVLDCSVAIAWLFEDETTPETEQLLERLKDTDAYVPSLWRLELGNILIQSEKRGRITAGELTSYLNLLATLPIITDTETDERAFREILVLSQTEALTTYDAAYLELAMRRGIPLATLDKTLARVAKNLQLETLPA